MTPTHVDRLLADGHEFTVLYDFSTGHRDYLTESAQLNIVEGDLRDFDNIVGHCTQNVD